MLGPNKDPAKLKAKRGRIIRHACSLEHLITVVFSRLLKRCDAYERTVDIEEYERLRLSDPTLKAGNIHFAALSDKTAKRPNLRITAKLRSHDFRVHLSHTGIRPHPYSDSAPSISPRNMMRSSPRFLVLPVHMVLRLWSIGNILQRVVDRFEAEVVGGTGMSRFTEAVRAG